MPDLFSYFGSSKQSKTQLPTKRVTFDGKENLDPKKKAPLSCSAVFGEETSILDSPKLEDVVGELIFLENDSKTSKKLMLILNIVDRFKNIYESFNLREETIEKIEYPNQNVLKATKDSIFSLLTECNSNDSLAFSCESALHLISKTKKERLKWYQSRNLMNDERTNVKNEINSFIDEENETESYSKQNISIVEGNNESSNSSPIVRRKTFSQKKSKRVSFLFDDDENSTRDSSIFISSNNENNIINDKISINYIKDSHFLSSQPEKSTHFTDITHVHQTLLFLKDSHRRDKNGILHTDPESDPTTLLVPLDYLNSKKVTPVLKQWWKLKSENFDTILLFKMGKFYETYHMDSDIAVKELGLIYMKGEIAHAGFPEASYPQHSSALIQKGYKVARVEQTETPSMMNERVKGLSGSSLKVVKREICSITSSGTRIFDPFDVEVDSCSSNSSGNSVGFGLLLCIVDTKESNRVCILDCSTGRFVLSHLVDDELFSALRILLSSFSIPVAEIITPKGLLSSETRTFIHKFLSHCRKEISSQKIDITSVYIMLASYFDIEVEKIHDIIHFPSSNQQNPIEKDNTLDFDITLLALGHTINYLKKNLIDRRVITMANIHWYIPSDKFNDSTTNEIIEQNICAKNDHSILPPVQKYMILNHNALSNLDILSNSDDNIFNKNGSLLGLLDHCVTPFGRRLLPSIVTQPLYIKEDIDERLDAMDEILKWDSSFTSEITEQLKSLPDLDRLLFRIHACGNVIRNQEHPDNRAVLFNEDTINKRKVNDLIQCIKGFRKLTEIVEFLKDSTLRSTILNDLFINRTTSDCFKKTLETVLYFEKSFDMIEAQQNGKVVPLKGVIPEYDEAIDQIQLIQDELGLKLREFKNQLSTDNVKYWHSGKIRYYIEVPDKVKNVPDDFIYKSQRKGFSRYEVESIQMIVSQLLKYEESRNKSLKNSLGLVMEKFALHKTHLKEAIYRISMFDCLLSFATFSSGLYNNAHMCRPNIIKYDENNNQQLIKIEQGYHPYLATQTANFVENDFVIGDLSHKNGNELGESKTMIITGPNMGGKSTLMRQVAIIVILAQLGCYVPAKSCHITPIDRIFARLGASFDKPLNGQSTFYIELLETSNILSYATSKSLVILDELGRGTSTHDGMAIASSVLEHITSKINCLLLFSTHYHELVRNISLSTSLCKSFLYYQMSFVIQRSQNYGTMKQEFEDKNEKSQIVFLYKLAKGVCSNSYGFHAASLAGLPDWVLKTGKQKSLQVERSHLVKQLLFCIEDRSHVDNLREIESLVTEIKNLNSI